MSSSRKAQLCVFLSRTSQGSLQHSTLPGRPTPTVATRALQNLSDTSSTLGVVSHVKSPSHPNTRKKYARACQQQWPKKHRNAVYSESSPVPHQALKSNHHIAAITNPKLGARSPTETTRIPCPGANALPRSLPSLSPSPDLAPPLRTLACHPPHSSAFLCVLCNLRKKTVPNSQF